MNAHVSDVEVTDAHSVIDEVQIVKSSNRRRFGLGLFSVRM